MVTSDYDRVEEDDHLEGEETAATSNQTPATIQSTPAKSQHFRWAIIADLPVLQGLLGDWHAISDRKTARQRWALFNLAR